MPNQIKICEYLFTHYQSFRIRKYDFLLKLPIKSFAHT